MSERAEAIAIVIPTHGGRFLPAAVESVRDQTVTDWELVIVDDGSRDGTAATAAALAATDGRIRVVTHPRNLGIVAARNRGLDAIAAGAHGYVAFLDHDDVWPPRTLELLRAALIAEAGAGAAHGRAIAIDGDGRAIADAGAWHRLGITMDGLVAWPRERPTTFANLAYENCITSTGSCLIRRAALDAVGGFDPRAEPSDDYDLWIRLARRRPIRFVDDVVLHYRLHGDRTSLRPRHARGRGTPYVKHKLITSPDNDAHQRRLAVAGFRARQRRLFGERAADLARNWRAGRYGDAGAAAVDLVARVAAFVRGRPWSWHR